MLQINKTDFILRRFSFMIKNSLKNLKIKLLNSSFLGKKIEYDPLWEGPMKQQRTSTDFSMLITFIVCLGLWGLIAVYGKLAVFHFYIHENE